jgi:hypothetical protein
MEKERKEKKKRDQRIGNEKTETAREWRPHEIRETGVMQVAN